MAREESLPVELARRIALAAQGLADPRPAGPVDAGHLLAAIERVGQLQLDSVNVLCRAHYLPVFARLGPYPRALLDEMAWGTGPRQLFEYWGHRAALLPVSAYPLLRWRMEAARRWAWAAWPSPDRPGQPPPDWRRTLDPALHLAPWAVIAGMARLGLEQPAFVDQVLAVVAQRGPVAAAAASPDGLRHGDGQDVGTGRLWNWHDAKIALEWLLYEGRVATAARRGFERFYDLTERVVPSAALTAPAPSPEDAQRELVRIAARAQGIATEKELRQYFHLPAATARARIAELVDSGELLPARVAGVPQRTYLWALAGAPADIAARALLSPFDSLIWDRDRTERLFGFRYRISIYTPAAQRAQGYYVLPFLLGDRLVARVDLKADRRRAALRVEGAHAEAGSREGEVAPALAAELRLMAAWLGLERVEVAPSGDLSPALRRAVG